MTESALTVPLHVDRRHRVVVSVASIVMTVVSIAWIVVDLSWLSVVVGVTLIALFGWLWTTMLVAKRVAGNAPQRLTITRDGLSSPWWALPWDRVSRVWIGHTHSQTGSLRALFIEPIRESDIALPASRILRLNAVIGRAAHAGRISILEANIDRPLEQLLDELEDYAGRPLRAWRQSRSEWSESP